MNWLLKKSKKEAVPHQSTISSVKTLLISDYLNEKSICFLSSDLNKEEILSKLINVLSTSDSKSVFKAILEREKMGGTIINETTAIPHTRIKGLKNIQLAIGLINRSVPHKNIPKLYFLFLTPLEDTQKHLLFLSSLSSVFQTEGFVDQLLCSKTALEVIQKIRELEKETRG